MNQQLVIFLLALMNVLSFGQNHFDYEDERVIDVVIMGKWKALQHYEGKKMLSTWKKISLWWRWCPCSWTWRWICHELGGWEAESEASQLLQNLNISEDLHYQTMSELANGDKVKVLLAKSPFFGKPDVLLLDEPTNGLDIQSITWLKIFWLILKIRLSLYPMTAIFWIKSAPIWQILTLEKIKLYVGNYDFWKESSELNKITSR